MHGQEIANVCTIRAIAKEIGNETLLLGRLSNPRGNGRIRRCKNGVIGKLLKVCRHAPTAIDLRQRHGRRPIGQVGFIAQNIPYGISDGESQMAVAATSNDCKQDSQSTMHTNHSKG